MKGNLEVVEILVKNGADIRRKGYKEVSWLFWYSVHSVCALSIISAHVCQVHIVITGTQHLYFRI